MGQNNYVGFEKVIKDALVAARGEKTSNPTEQRILELERKLETAKLSQSEISDLQKQLKLLLASKT
jgi:hypothetical protein